MLVALRSLYEQAGPVTPSLNLAATESADTASGAVGLAVSASLSATEGADTASGAVGLVARASLSAMEGADTASATLRLVSSSALAATEGADTAASFIGLAIGVALSASEGADQAAGEVSLDAGGSDVSLDATDGADTCEATATCPDAIQYTGGWTYVWKRRKKVTTEVTPEPEPEPVPVLPKRAVRHDRWMPPVAAVVPKPAKRKTQEVKTRKHHEDALRLLLLAS